MGITAIILAAGYGTRLHRDLDVLPSTHQLASLKGTPKPLLPVHSGHPLIDFWLDEFQFCHALKTSQKAKIDHVFLVTNHAHYPLYSHWAASHGLPLSHIIDDGSNSNDERLGAVACIDLVIKQKAKEIGSNDVLIVAGDTLFANDFQLSTYLETREDDGDNVVYYELVDPTEVSKRGIIEIDHHGIVKNFIEKPSPSETASRLACPAFYLLRNQSLRLVGDFIVEKKDAPLAERDAPGLFISWLQRKTRVYARKISGRFDIGNLDDYIATLKTLENLTITRANARVGLVGNPSDGFNGKTISYSLANYWAQVKIWETKHVKILPNEVFDTTKFLNLEELATRTQITGYYGGIRLLRATCKRFFELTEAAKIKLTRNFTICYNSNIPFAVGLAGSSAIVTASFRALMMFYQITLADLGLTEPKLPNEILAIEREELGITAGLQDRVIQAYEGVVFMDFSKALLDQQGHGNYERLNVDDLPTFYLAYQVKAGGESGKIHSDVRKRWEQGDPLIVDGMKVFAGFTDEAKAAIPKREHAKLASLMNQNFGQRKKLYSEKVLGEDNLRMIKLATDNGFAAAFTGSGGAINCLYHQHESKKRKHEESGEAPCRLDEAEEARIKKLFEQEGFHFERSRIRRAEIEPTFVWD